MEISLKERPQYPPRMVMNGMDGPARAPIGQCGCRSLAEFYSAGVALDVFVEEQSFGRGFGDGRNFRIVNKPHAAKGFDRDYTLSRLSFDSGKDSEGFCRLFSTDLPLSVQIDPRKSPVAWLLCTTVAGKVQGL